MYKRQVVNGCCERCGTTVTKKNLRQWMLKITAYAERLLNDLDKLDWPEKVKKMQTDWIGKSYGAEVDFPIDGREEKITVYTTRPDTLYGATFKMCIRDREKYYCLDMFPYPSGSGLHVGHWLSLIHI